MAMPAKTLRLPWSENRDRAVKEGSKLNLNTILPESLCGFYPFVWDSWTEMENTFDIDDEDTSMTISIEPGTTEVGGSFLWWRKVGTFQSLVRDEKETANYWNCNKVEWSDREGYTPEAEEGERQHYGHGIAVLKTLDDAGNPFVELIYNAGHRGQCGNASYMRAIGKKQKKNGWKEPLSRAEAHRLVKDGAATFEDLESESESAKDESEGEGEGESEGGSGSESESEGEGGSESEDKNEELEGGRDGIEVFVGGG